MIKRVTAIFFILLANIMLLANAVIPHHHHNREVCIVSSHCQTDDKAHKHNTNEHSHKHDGNKNAECCVLKQVIGISVNHVRQEYKCFEFNDNHSPFNDLQSVPLKNELNVYGPTFLSNAQKILNTSGHTYFIICASGLRAPPFV